MKLTIAKSAGFCFGVKRALAIALKAAESGRKVYMLGDIVHNEIVVEEMKASGIRKIKHPGRGRGRTLLIRAHGAGRSTIAGARRAGYKIIDATCPMVKEIHAIAKEMERDNRTIIVIGDKEHDEVRGIVGQLKRKPIVISSRRDISRKVPKHIKRAGIVVQSTQEESKVLGMAAALRERSDDLVFKNTICNPTKTKQREAKILPVENDIVIVVGSKSSANTKRLYQISSSINGRTHWVNYPDEIRPAWFKGAKSVGITAGASTPESSISAVTERIRLLELKREIRAESDPEKAKILQGFFKTGPGEYGEGDIFLGLTVPKIRILTKRYSSLDPRTVEILLGSPIHEERLAAALMLVLKFNKAAEAERERIYRSYLKNTAYINSWDLVDLTAAAIAGEFLKNKDKAVLYKLARSKNMWERRIAIVSTFCFIKTGASKETFAIADILLDDSHDLIHKAVGWMLREVGKRIDIGTEERFLKARYKKMPRTMLRYAIERFPQARRRAYLKGMVN